ncbi:cytosine deaminase [Ovoidimarina sediminis]|uniref:cytosine deaminase n=1 Tax=Ovoidimarina sediminis TaxID=3079856 RepID=UPI00290BDFA1|nr:cytosine deaminase [Rhodophyticola sp. MJ-SS7]MDU8942979.1 cytosine deaminase [Rhodophyticola sp. MJ-SS7]
MPLPVLPEGPVTLRNASVPGCFVGESASIVRRDISIADGTISDGAFTAIDLNGAMIFPAFVDMHTHLDKGHIWPRAANPDGSFMGALTTVGVDRAANWLSEDVRARMTFSLRCAYAHGTRAIRTHLDSLPPQGGISWPVFAEVREEWAGRIALQGSSLVGCDSFESIARDYAETAALVANHGGVLGMVTYPVPDVARRIRDFIDLSDRYGLEADFHVDESLDPGAETLRAIAEAVIETGWDAPVTVGHCCSLSVQDEARALDTLDLVAKAGIRVVSLPMCNLYLQDRRAGRTPRNRGITLVHEMAERGISVAFASDNTRDPFYAYGDMDMIEVMREATRIGHLDHSREDWPRAFTSTPAEICGFAAPDLSPGAPADLVVCAARDWTELFARPQADRIVIRSGRPIDRMLPDYAELDHLMRP